MSLEHLYSLNEGSRHVTRLGVINPPVFLHRFACIDGRCRWATYRGRGQQPLACKQHRLPGAHVTRRNDRAVAKRLAHDAQRARKQLGLSTLAIYESHSRCAYRELCHGMSEGMGWAHFQHHLGSVPDTALAWVQRDVDTGAMTVVGRHGAVDAATLSDAVDPQQLIPKLRDLGYADANVAATLAALLVGNVAYRATMVHSPEHQEQGVIVGAHIFGHRHFAVSNRMVTELDEALEVAANLLEPRVERPFLLAAIARNPQRRLQEYDSVGRLLLTHIRASLRRINRERSFELYRGTVCKESGELSWRVA